MTGRVAVILSGALVVLAGLLLVVLEAPPTVAIVVVGALAAGLVCLLLVRQHRATMRVLTTNRRRVRTIAATTSGLGSQVRRLEEELVGRAALGERQVRAEAAELSKQLASLRHDVLAGQERLAADLRDQRRRLDDAARRSSPADTQGARPAVTSRPAQLDDTALQRIQHTATAPGVVLVLDSFTPGQLFAGVRTTVVFACGLAAAMRRPLRVVVIRDPGLDLADATELIADWVSREAGHPSLLPDLRLVLPSDPDLDGFHVDDVWIATYWATARAVGLAVSTGAVRRDRVVYLVQDWEPGFFPWGDRYAAARRTYDLGFQWVVNSTPLARYLADQTGRTTDEELVFRPEVDESRLREAAARWTPPPDPRRPRVLFYARPGKPRNLFELGVDALRSWAGSQADGVRPLVRLAGEEATAVELGAKVDVEMCGKLTLEEYHELLTETDLGLALMHSPHPSHLPLELAMTGIPTVTNAFEGYRRPWLDQLVVADATATQLADALSQQQRRGAGARVHLFEPMPADLGVPIATAVRRVARDLQKGSPA